VTDSRQLFLETNTRITLSLMRSRLVVSALGYQWSFTWHWYPAHCISRNWLVSSHNEFKWINFFST